MLNTVCNARLAYNQTFFPHLRSEECRQSTVLLWLIEVKKLMLMIIGIQYLQDIMQGKLKDDIKRKITSMQWQTYCQDLLDMVCIFLWVCANLWRDKLLLFFLNSIGTEAGEEEYWGLVQCEISAWLKKSKKMTLNNRYSYIFIINPFVFLTTVLEINTIIVSYATKA